jgi:hypothetical protein
MQAIRRFFLVLPAAGLAMAASGCMTTHGSNSCATGGCDGGHPGGGAAVHSALSTVGNGHHVRNAYDPCGLERYSATATESVRSSFAPQVHNGMILDQTVFNYHFEQGTDKLLPGGLDKLDQIVRRRPEPCGKVMLATTRDISYDPAKPEDYTNKRQELDAKRIVAVQKYLTAQTAGRPMTFDVAIHDPPEPGAHAAIGRQSLMMHHFTGSPTIGLGGMGGGGGGSGGQCGGGGGGQGGIGGGGGGGR